MPPTDALRPLLIAVAGGSGSGKTTLAHTLARRLGADRCAVLEHDAYYRDLAHLSPEERAAVNFDHPESLENGLLARHLVRLRDGRPVLRPRYDFATHTRIDGHERVEPRPFVLCDGILLLAAPELGAIFDLRIFLDVPADIRILRRLERDVRERGRSLASVVGQYLTTVRPMHERFVEPSRRKADLLLDWRDDLERWTEAACAAIERKARELAPGRAARG